MFWWKSNERTREKERPSVDFQTEWRTTFVEALGFDVSA
jgi:hypothetical protein